MSDELSNGQVKLSDIVEKETPDPSEGIKRRLKYKNTAKALIWLAVHFEQHDFVYSPELATYLNVTTTRASQILHDFELSCLLYRHKTPGTFNEYYPTKNDNQLVIKKYLRYAMETLGYVGVALYDEAEKKSEGEKK